MHVSYKGVQKALPAKLQQKLDAKFAKLSKLLERRGEREAHVIVTSERRLHKAEITIQFYDHQLVADAKDADLFHALHSALEKLEQQAVKQRGKWREKRRSGTPRTPTPTPVAKAAPKTAVKTKPRAASPAAAIPQRIFKINHRDGHKPMTLDEALIEMEQDRDYLVYRDAKANPTKDGISVLVRRRDGHFDLIES